MLTYALLNENGNELQYEYFPEGGTAPGVVSYNKETGECYINKLSEKDKHQMYALKLFKKIRDFERNGSFQKEGMIAWY